MTDEFHPQVFCVCLHRRDEHRDLGWCRRCQCPGFTRARSATITGALRGEGLTGCAITTLFFFAVTTAAILSAVAVWSP